MHEMSTLRIALLVAIEWLSARNIRGRWAKRMQQRHPAQEQEVEMTGMEAGKAVWAYSTRARTVSTPDARARCNGDTVIRFHR